MWKYIKKDQFTECKKTDQEIRELISLKYANHGNQYYKGNDIPHLKRGCDLDVFVFVSIDWEKLEVFRNLCNEYDTYVCA